MAEWSIAMVLKTIVLKSTLSSNLSPSALKYKSYETSTRDR